MSKKVLVHEAFVGDRHVVIDAETDLLCDDDKFIIGEEVEVFLADADFKTTGSVSGIEIDEYGTLILLRVRWGVRESIS